jgi:hypothetical protein
MKLDLGCTGQTSSTEGATVVDSTTFDAITRAVGASAPRRTALRGLLAGAAASVAGDMLQTNDASAKRRKRKNKKKAKKSPTAPIPEPQPDPLPEPNPCEGKNWCLDRSLTCGPASGTGKCLVEAGGANICGEIVFQAATCAKCASTSCPDCRCVLAAGGGDRCNNGADGEDFVCVRAV